MPPGQLCAATWRPVQLPGQRQGIGMKGAQPRLILASPGHTQQRRETCFVVTLGRVVPLAHRAQGCRTPCGAQGNPTGEPAATHVGGAKAPGHLLQAGCVNTLGLWGECVACEPSVCEHGQCVHVSLCARGTRV